MKQLISLLVSCLLFSTCAECSPADMMKVFGPKQLPVVTPSDILSTIVPKYHLIVTQDNIVSATGYNRPGNGANSSITRNSEANPVFKMRISNSKDQKISILMVNSAIQVIGYDGDELKIESKNYVPLSSQAEGLKPLYNSTPDNTKMGLSVVKENDQVKITQASHDHFNYTIYLPDNVSLSYEELGDQGADLAISDINGEIEVKIKEGNASLINVAGPVIANSTNSNIKVVFSNSKSNKPCAFTSINGSIDIALSSQNQSNLKLRSVTGEIYTDFAIVMDGSANLPTIIGGHAIYGKINGGGSELTVHTVNNNIFVRKRK